MSIQIRLKRIGSKQGLSVISTAGIVNYSEDYKKAKTQLWAKDAVYGWILIHDPDGLIFGEMQNLIAHAAHKKIFGLG